jgi:hypothetical protein
MTTATTTLTLTAGDMRNSFRTKRVVDRFESAGLIVEVAQIVVHEGDEPDVLVHWLTATFCPVAGRATK